MRVAERVLEEGLPLEGRHFRHARHEGDSGAGVDVLSRARVQHRREARARRQLRHARAALRKPRRVAGAVQSAEARERFGRFADLCRVGLRRERKSGNVVHAEGLGVQDHVLQRHGVDLRRLVVRQSVCINSGRVKSVNVARCRAAGATGALVRRRLGDPSHFKGHRARVALHAPLRAARVDDVAHAGDCERRLGHVRRHHHHARAVGRHARRR
mmetsp:Transcript_2346/g.6974  ORF Transcript_2346/g.6974 Transcript_2346/m.6974 type:complete len:214 (+) Transcript_2346:2015-2656(+)